MKVSYFRVLLSVICGCELGGVGDLVLELRDASQDVVDGGLALPSNDGNGSEPSNVIT